MRRLVLLLVVAIAAVAAASPPAGVRAATRPVFLYVHNTNVFGFVVNANATLTPLGTFVTEDPVSGRHYLENTTELAPSSAFSTRRGLLFTTGENGVTVFQYAG